MAMTESTETGTSLNGEVPSIHRRMSTILEALPAIGKDARNEAMRFNYRSIDSILNAINPLLGRHGVYLQPRVLDVRLELRSTKSGQANAAVVTMAYLFTAEDGSCVKVESVGEGQDSGDKAVSKAMTMALKTALGQTFAISTEEDPDAQAAEEPAAPKKTTTRKAKPAPKEQEPEPEPTPAEPSLAEQRAGLVERIRSLAPFERDQLRKWMAEDNIPESIEDLTAEHIQRIHAKIDTFDPF